MRVKSGIPFEGGDEFVSFLCKRMAERAGWNGSFEDGDDIILRQSPPSLLSAALVNRLKIISPRTWWGMIDLESKRGSLTSFDMSTMTKSAMGLLLPVLVLSLLRLTMLRKIHSASTKLSPRMLATILISPWSLQCLYQLYYQLSMPWKYFRAMVSAPSSTLVRATDALKLRIYHRRAYRTPRYDVYFPPSLDSPDAKALLFLPGASVSHEAYSEVAARLSDQGFVVAVMSLEPFRLASCHFGANPSSVKRIIQEVTKNIHNLALENQSDEMPAKTIEWTLMGHSMGAFGAMQLFRTLLDDPRHSTQTKSKDKNRTSNIDIKVGKKLVLWGVAAFVEAATDISDQKDVEVLILQGTNDVLVDMKRSRQGELEALFPLNNTTTKYIRGGTHEGFGSYQPSFQVPKGGKKKRYASLDRQHKQACDETVRFLRGQ